MKVNIEAQSLCGPSIRGIAFYTANIIKGLINHNRFQYSISFFDYMKERNNIQYIEKYILSDQINTDIAECNSINYKDILKCCLYNDFSMFDKSYDEYLHTDADVFHFTNSSNYPYAITKNTVVTVHDIMPIIFDNNRYYYQI